MCWILVRHCISTLMKQLKYILSLLFFFLGFFSENLKAEIVILESEKIESFSEQDFNEISEEQVWLGLLHLQEEPTCQNRNSPLKFSLGSFSQNFSGELCLKSISENIESSFHVSENLESHHSVGRWDEIIFIQSTELVDAWKKMDNLGADDAIRKNPGALDALAKKDAGEVVPDPSTYLDADYIANHLAKFDDGAVRFTTQSKIDNYGTLGGDEAFTMPKSEFDDLIVETGGDLAQVEQKLGLDAGELTGDNAVIAWVKKEDMGEVKMPSGNEGGANDQWIPGGKTSGGVSEGVSDLSNPDLDYDTFPF